LDQPLWESRDRLALSISEAAQVCGVRRRTIRRRQKAGEFEHAYKDPDGTWRIPVSDLVASGLRPNVVSDPDEPRIVFTAASQVDRLRTEVAVLRERVRALEIIAREREERVTDLRTVLRMLPAPRETVDAPISPMEESFLADEAGPTSQAEAEQASEAEVEPLVEASEDFVPDGIDQEPLHDEVRAAMTSPEPAAEPEEAASPLRVTSPFDAPEPIVILPDVPGRQSEPSEGALERSAEMLETARQRSTELLEDAMSLWWPSPASPTRSQPPAASSSTPWESEQSPRVDVATQSREGSQPTGVVTSATPAVPAPDKGDDAPDAADPKEGELFTPEPVEEASFEWLDPNFGRPPRHQRRRLGRFFRRHRRPR
jgi:hypothetical protein